MNPSERDFTTRVIHAGETRIGGAAVPPIHQSTVFEQTDPDASYDDIRYPRLNNTPNHLILGQKLADFEGGESGLVVSSGMAAITATLMTLGRNGGHVLVQDCLYGGTHAFVHQRLAEFGITFDVLPADPDEWPALVRPETRAIYVEALTNPLLHVIDHEAVVAFARQHGIPSVIDSTFASPVNFAALTFGYDVAVHSATKYLNGHSDLCAGVIVTDDARMRDIVGIVNLLGGSLDAMGCYLLHRGLRTLALRVPRQNATAAALAAFLAEHPAVSAVHYPTLPDHPDHDRATRLFRGCGGVLAFEPTGGVEAAQAVLERLELALHAPSLGGPETLITRPCTSSHASISAEERAALGIRDELLRVSVGLEHPDDLRLDFDRALSRPTSN